MAVDIFARTVALASLGNSSGDSYTKAEIDKMFGEAGTVQVEAVDVLPTENIRENVIYLVPNGSSGENYYDECMYINGKWEVIGTTEIDLSNYYTKDEVDNKSIVNIALPKSTFEGSSGNIRQEDYQAFLPLLQFLYNKCRGISGYRFIKLPLVNINTAHDSSTWLDLDNGQLFVVNEQYTKTNNTINIRLDGVPKLDESGVAKYFRLYVGGNIENDNITSIRSVSINKTTIPVATKKYVDDSIANINVSFDDVYVVTCGHRFDANFYNITDDGSIAEMMNTYWPKYLANRNQGGLVIWKDYTSSTNGTTLIGYMWGPEIYIQWPWNSQNNGLVNKPYGSVGVVTITGSWDSSTETFTLTRAVWNRTNYVPTKDWNPANKKYVDDSIRSAIAGVTQFSLVPVDTLPTENIRTDAIYAVPSDNPQEQDVRIEYVYINDSWEILGNTKIDLSNTVIDGGTF